MPINAPIASSTRPNHEGRDTEPASVEDLLRDAHVILDNCGVTLSPSKVVRLVRTYQHQVQHNGFAFFTFLANSVQLDRQRRHEALMDPEIRRVISYADHTGETAVNHVMNAGGGDRAS